jgi:hypothetical protein
MSDEKRREELKAIINEQLDKLSIEDLESVAGGIIVKNDDGTYSVYDKKSGTNSENGYTDPGTPIWVNGDNLNVTV